VRNPNPVPLYWQAARLISPTVAGLPAHLPAAGIYTRRSNARKTRKPAEIVPQSPTPETPISTVSALRMSFRRSHIRRRPRLFGEPKSAVTVPEPQNAPKSALTLAVSRRAIDQTHGWLSANSMWAVKGLKKLGESAESESVQLRARRAILHDLIKVADYADLEYRVAEIEEEIRARKARASHPA
jgi:hypothetical protein